MDFRSGTLVVSAVTRYFSFLATNGYINDSLGNTLFYSNGVYVANALDDTMLNGGDLNPSHYTTSGNQFGLRLAQGNVVIPIPGLSNKYYLFHEAVDDDASTYASLNLYYSIIDMTLDNGLGGVVQKNTVVLHDSLLPGHLSACRHANGRDWWLIAPKFNDSLINVFLITPFGIQNTGTQNLHTYRDNGPGQVVFSQDGTKYARYDPTADLDIYDFDRCSGQFTNQVHISINDTSGAGGIAFSQSGRFLYASSLNYVYQFDITAANIASSKTTVARYDGYMDDGIVRTQFYLAKLAPDNKIYIVSTTSMRHLHVINYPDSLGTACDLQQHSVLIPGYIVSTLPTFPNYFLQAEGGSICDTLGLPNTISSATSGETKTEVFPNPARNLFYVTQNTADKFAGVHLFNSFGQEQNISFTGIKNGEYLQTDVTALPAGVYFVELLLEKSKIVKRFIKE